MFLMIQKTKHDFNIKGRDDFVVLLIGRKIELRNTPQNYINKILNELESYPKHTDKIGFTVRLLFYMREAYEEHNKYCSHMKKQKQSLFDKFFNGFIHLL
jgi:hypothetical protein